MAAESDAALAVHGEADPAAPGEPAGVSRHGLDRDGVGQTGQPGQLLGQPEGLEPALRRRRDVLVVTAPAAARPRMGTGWLDPVGRCLEDLDGVGPAEMRSSWPSPGPGPARPAGSGERRRPVRPAPGPRSRHRPQRGRPRPRAQARVGCHPAGRPRTGSVGPGHRPESSRRGVDPGAVRSS